MLLSDICARAADIAAERGLARYIEEDGDGRVCFVGAVNLAEKGEGEAFITNQTTWRPIRDWFEEDDIGRRIVPEAPPRVGPIIWSNEYARDADDLVHAFKLAAEHFAEIEEAS